MERLPADLCLKIFCWLDHQNLATAQQVCKKWNFLASDNKLWSNLFKERWGEDRAAFYEPDDSKSWKDVYEVQDRGDRVGLGLKIIREGGDYYLVHQGEIHQYLGSRRQRKGTDSCPLNSKGKLVGDESLKEEKPSQGILDQMLFFIGDLEVASTDTRPGSMRRKSSRHRRKISGVKFLSMYDVEYYQLVPVFILLAIEASRIPIISLMFSN